jgi:hypothetical protein
MQLLLVDKYIKNEREITQSGAKIKYEQSQQTFKQKKETGSIREKTMYVIYSDWSQATVHTQ